MQTISTLTGRGYTAFHYAAAHGFSGLLREKTPRQCHNSTEARCTQYILQWDMNTLNALTYSSTMITKLCICLYAGPRNRCSPLISPRNTGSSQKTLIKHDDGLDLSNISARNNEVFFDWTLSDEPCIGKTRPNATPLHLAVRLATTISRNCFSSVVLVSILPIISVPVLC